MRIKRVVIEAFASYDKIEMKDEFSPGCNLILGKNGCGKSNFLQGKCLKQKMNSSIVAIIFALSDSWRLKTKQEKRTFLHVRNSTKYYLVISYLGGKPT